MKKLLIAVIASTFGLAAVATHAKEVNLNDDERMELRQRVDGLKAQNAFGQTRDVGARRQVVRATDARPMKVKRAHKHTRKHSKRGHYKKTT